MSPMGTGTELAADEVRVEKFDPKIGPTDAQYKLVTWRTVKDITGKNVQVESGSQILTVENLEREKVSLQTRIDAIDAQLAQIEIVKNEEPK